MRLRQTESLAGLISLLMVLATFCGGAWASPNSCSYAPTGTGMGGTGMIARGTGMGGTGVSPEAADATQIAGNVIFSQGSVEAQRNGNSRLLAQGDAVCEGETIVTAQSGTVQMRMADNAMIAVRPDTQLKIEKYVYGGTREDNSLIALLKGASRFITGEIGKANPQNDLIITPTATVGVRGTDHEVTVILPNDQGAYPSGTYDKVNSGITFIKTAKGEIDIHPDQVGFAAIAGELPVLLNEIPDFERAGTARQKEDARFQEGSERNETGDSIESGKSPEQPVEDIHSEHPEAVTPAIESPEIPNGVDLPEGIEIPETPAAPEAPSIPEVPSIPETPEIPETPAIPDSPEL
jgi:hypothetical protein